MYQLTIQNKHDGYTYDVSDFITENIAFETALEPQAGKLTFSLITDSRLPVFTEGSVVSFKENADEIFFGYLFKVDETNDKISFTAYDQMRYLKNKDSMVISNHTASSLFETICKNTNLRYKVVTSSGYIIADAIKDNSTYFEIMQYGIDQTLINDGRWYHIYDKFGTLQFVDLNGLKTEYVVSDDAILKTTTLTSSIDEDTYNQIKLMKENKETKKREVYIVQDSNKINEWGLLQYYESVDENANEAQIKERADMLLKLKNRKTQIIKIPCIGNNTVQAGSGIIINIPVFNKYNIINNRYYLVSKCTHKYSQNEHSMDLEVDLSI
jgi:hypothetical protein